MIININSDKSGHDSDTYCRYAINFSWNGIGFGYNEWYKDMIKNFNRLDTFLDEMHGDGSSYLYGSSSSKSMKSSGFGTNFNGNTVSVDNNNK